MEKQYRYAKSTTKSDVPLYLLWNRCDSSCHGSLVSNLFHPLALAQKFRPPFKFFCNYDLQAVPNHWEWKCHRTSCTSVLIRGQCRVMLDMSCNWYSISLDSKELARVPSSSSLLVFHWVAQCLVSGRPISRPLCIGLLMILGIAHQTISFPVSNIHCQYWLLAQLAAQNRVRPRRLRSVIRDLCHTSKWKIWRLLCNAVAEHSFVVYNIFSQVNFR